MGTDYTTAFEKPFTNVKNLLIGILLSILPIINWFAIGFAMKCSGVGKTKPSKKMPEWKNFGDLFTKGFFASLISLIYMIPAIIILAFSLGGVLVTYFSQIPMDQIANKTSEEVQVILQPIIDSTAPALVAAIPFILLALLLAFLAAYVLPIAILSYLEKENFSEAFKIKKIFSKSFKINYFAVWLVSILASMILGALLNIIPILGRPAASFIVLVISFSLFGQIYLNKKK